MGQVQTVDRRPTPSPSHALATSRSILEELFGPVTGRAFRVRFWTGDLDGPSDLARPPFTLVLSGPSALRRMLIPPGELSMIEAYLSGDIDIEGDLEAATDLADAVAARVRSARALGRVLRLAFALPRPESRSEAGEPARRRAWWVRPRGSVARAAAANRFHYDLGNGFFELFLDRRLLYTCAYYPTGAEDLDAAQEAKLDLICRKLRLRQGERLLDIGCGWGGLVLHAAERYGARALGITLSEEQARLARDRIGRSGSAHLCRIEVRDYRDLPAGDGFDKVASIGMTEHIPRRDLPSFYRTAFALTRPGGLYLNQCVIKQPSIASAPFGRRLARRLWGTGQFIGRYVFPDTDVKPAGEVLLPAEQAGFDVRDVENLRDHYVLTTRAWLQRLQQRRAEAVALVGEATYRVFRLYLAGGARMQRSGRDGVIQALMARPLEDGRTGLPLTRADLYEA